MAKEQGDTSDKFSYLRQSQAEQLASRLKKGEFIYPDEVVEFLRQEQHSEWPRELLSHICGLLDGSIRPKPGPRPNPYALQENLAYRFMYHVFKNWDVSELEIPEEIVEFIKKNSENFHHNLSRHERAARLTSIWFHGHSKSHATILNRIFSHK